MEASAKPPLLTVAGYDPSSGAGVTADLQVFSAHRRFGISAISALTVQSTQGVRRIEAIKAETLAESLDCLQNDLPPAGVKIGMLASAENVRVVARFLRGYSVRPVTVLDPILRSSSGAELLSAEGLTVLLEELLPLVDWVTPNRLELAALLGEALGDAERQGHRLAEQYSGLGVIVTGGDHTPPTDLALAPGEEIYRLEGERVETTATHGTGCAFSSAFLCGLADGKPWRKAASAAKLYVYEALRQAIPRGKGRGPMHLLWPLTPPF